MSIAPPPTAIPDETVIPSEPFIIQANANGAKVVGINPYNTEWTNIYEEPIFIPKGSTVRVNYSYFATQAGPSLIRITDANNTAEVDVYYYWVYCGDFKNQDSVQYLYDKPFYVCDYSGNGFPTRPHKTTVTITIENGVYTVDQLALIINQQLVAPEATIERGVQWQNPPGGNNQYYLYHFVSSPVFNLFLSPSYTGDQNNQRHNFAGFPLATPDPNETNIGFNPLLTDICAYAFGDTAEESSIPNAFSDGTYPFYYPTQHIGIKDQYRGGVAGAPNLTFTYNDNGNSKFSFSNLHIPYYSNGTPSIRVNWREQDTFEADTETEQPVLTRQGGAGLVLKDSQLWRDLGFNTEAEDPTQYITTNQEFTTAFYTTTSFPQNTTFATNSTVVAAPREPTLFKDPFYLIKSDMMDTQNYYNEEGKASNIGFIAKNEASSGFVYSFRNSYEVTIHKDLMLGAITTTIIDPRTGAPSQDGRSPDTTIIYEVTPPPRPVSPPAMVIEGEEMELIEKTLEQQEEKLSKDRKRTGKSDNLMTETPRIDRRHSIGGLRERK